MNKMKKHLLRNNLVTFNSSQVIQKVKVKVHFIVDIIISQSSRAVLVKIQLSKLIDHLSDEKKNIKLRINNLL